MKINKFFFLLLVTFSINTLFADDMDEVVVTSALIDKAASELADPIHILTGEDIATEATQSLGESIDELLGVSSADYGSAVGQPIIRGMSGTRVKVLDNGMVNRDVSGLGADHLNDVDMSNVQQIEVVRGPSSLLYTNGTVGGIVNIVDNSIAMKDVERLFKVGAESQSVNDGDSQSFFYQDNVGGDINISLAYKNTSLGNFDVPNGAIMHEEEHHDEDEDHDEHEEEHDEHEESEVAYYDKAFNNSSIALNIGRELNDFLSVDFGFSSVERTPSTTEMFMNGAHLATARFEVGNVNLNSETSNNIDLTLNMKNGSFFAKATVFMNDVDNYIYLQDETEEEHEEHDEEHEEGHDDHGGLILANYLQQDAELDGYELEFGNTMNLGSGELTLSFGRDEISGEFSRGGNIPRLNPARNIFKLKYSQDNTIFGLMFKDVEKQNDIGLAETNTDGYQMLNAKLSRSFDLGGQGDLTVSLFGNNLLDEIARNHSSYAKTQVPLPGKNYGIRFNLTF